VAFFILTIELFQHLEQEIVWTAYVSSSIDGGILTFSCTTTTSFWQKVSHRIHSFCRVLKTSNLFQKKHQKNVSSPSFTQFGIAFARERKVTCHAPSFQSREESDIWKGDSVVDAMIEGQWGGHFAVLNVQFCSIGVRTGGVAVCSQPLYNGDWMEEKVVCLLLVSHHVSHVTRYMSQVPGILHTWITWHTQHIGLICDV
jgi:hypothetical protein